MDGVGVSANHPTFEDGVTTGRQALLAEILTHVAVRAEGVLIMAKAHIADSKGYAETLTDPDALDLDAVTFDEQVAHMRRAEQAHGKALELREFVTYLQSLVP